MELPKTEIPALKGGGEAPRDLRAGGEPAEVLVVDDNPAILDSLAAVVSAMGLNAVAARSGREALRQLLTRDFALILLDVNMPTMDGFETAALIRSRPRSAHVPIIFATAEAYSEEKRMRGYSVGAVDYIHSPILPEILRAKVQVFADLFYLNRRLAQQAEEIARNNILLEQASRMKSEFLASVSHELRTPLNAIIGFSELLKDELAGKLTGEQAGFAKDIFDSGVHLLSLINDILDLSKIEAGKMELVTEPLQIGSLLRDSLTIVKEKALKHRIALDLDLEGAPATLVADARKVKQIVYNLLSNAIKFTPDGGQVRVSARTVGREAVRLEAPQGVALRQLPLPDNAWREFVEIKVCDTGIGIAAANLDRLFQPFTQLDSSLARNYEGTGLGLSLVRRMTDLHGGAVAVASAEGKGSCFAVWLPLRNEAAAPEAPVMQPGEIQPLETRPELNLNAVRAEPDGTTSHSTKPASGQVAGYVEAQESIHISTSSMRTDSGIKPAEAAPARHALVIEDDSYAAELLRHHLQSAGFTVVWAPNAVRGLELATSTPPDLITLDLLLPGMGGWEALRIIKANPALTKVPVVIVSMVASKNTGLSLGAAKVLQKPVLRAELLGALRELGLGGKERGKFTVLAVDDDPKVLKLIAAHLATEKGCTLLTAGGGQAAIDKVRQAPPDLLILDLMMPGISGFDVVDALKADPATAALPILILTAKHVSEAERKRLNGNVLKIMEKSRFDPDNFLAEVRRALAGGGGGIGNEP